MEKTPERRNDVGLKIVYAIALFVVTFMLSLFFNHTYNVANAANGLANINAKDIAVLQHQWIEIDRRLTQIDTKIDKLLLR